MVNVASELSTQLSPPPAKGKTISLIGVVLMIAMGVFAIFFGTLLFHSIVVVGRGQRFALHFFDGAHIVSWILFDFFGLFRIGARGQFIELLANQGFWLRLLGIVIITSGLISLWGGISSLKMVGNLEKAEVLRDKLWRNLVLGIVFILFVSIFFSFQYLLLLVLLPSLIAMVGVQLAVDQATPLRLAHSSTSYWKAYFVRHWGLYAMLLLPVIFFIVFRYWPMINILLAFKENNVFLPIMQVEVHRNGVFGNFIQAFNLTFFRNSVRNTLVFSALDLIIGFPAPIILALLLNELKFKLFKRVTQTISYMPHFLSWIIVSGLAIQLFSTSEGTVNALIINQGLSPIPFLTSHSHWVWTNVLLAVWRSLGWNTIIYLAAITSVNPELYEAADVDGASRIRKMWNVTLPSIRPVIIVLFILALGGMMGADFERFMALSNPLVTAWSSVLPIFVFQWGLQSAMFSLSAAVGFIQALINVALLFFANMLVKKLGGSGLW